MCERECVGVCLLSVCFAYETWHVLYVCCMQMSDVQHYLLVFGYEQYVILLDTYLRLYDAML